MAKTPVYAEIGKRVREYRLAKGYSQEKTAELLGTSTTYYSRFERGSIGMKLSTLQKLAEILELDLNYVLLGQKKTSDPVCNQYLALLEKVPGNKEKSVRAIFDALTEIFEQDDPNG